MDTNIFLLYYYYYLCCCYIYSISSFFWFLITLCGHIILLYINFVFSITIHPGLVKSVYSPCWQTQSVSYRHPESIINNLWVADVTSFPPMGAAGAWTWLYLCLDAGVSESSPLRQSAWWRQPVTSQQLSPGLFVTTTFSLTARQDWDVTF